MVHTKVPVGDWQSQLAPVMTIKTLEILRLVIIFHFLASKLVQMIDEIILCLIFLSVCVFY